MCRILEPLCCVTQSITTYNNAYILQVTELQVINEKQKCLP